jgi:hypothetical protein
MGHKDPFPAPGLSGHCRFGQRTFAGRGGKEEEAPIADKGLGLLRCRCRPCTDVATHRRPNQLSFTNDRALRAKRMS